MRAGTDEMKHKKVARIRRQTWLPMNSGQVLYQGASGACCVSFHFPLPYPLRNGLSHSLIYWGRTAYSLTRPDKRFWWKWEYGPHSISAHTSGAEMGWGPDSHFHQNLFIGLVREYLPHPAGGISAFLAKTGRILEGLEIYPFRIGTSIKL